jgi:RNA polymerase sigma factor (sigma-70 family)
MPDRRLVASVRAGDVGAFEVIYDRHAAKLVSFCRHMLGSKEDAEDAVQRTLASAYRSLLADDRAIELRPWLFAIARNECISLLRQRRPLDELGREEVATDGLGARVEHREELRNLLADLRELPERQRAALLLYELGGLSHAQIAEVIDVRPDQVKAYVFQARSNLIAEREARNRSCAEVREELATARGPALLKRGLHRHIRRCEACREYADAVARQRRALALVLPVTPTLALRGAALRAALGGAHGGGGASGSGGAGLLIANAGAKTLAAKTAAVLVVAGLGAGAGTLALRAAPAHHSHPASSSAVLAQVHRGDAGADAHLAPGRVAQPAIAGAPRHTNTRRRAYPSRPARAAAVALTRGPVRPTATGAPTSGTSVRPLSSQVSVSHRRGEPALLRPHAGVVRHERASANARHGGRHGAAARGQAGRTHGHRESPSAPHSSVGASRPQKGANERGAASQAAPAEARASPEAGGGETTHNHAGSPGASGSAPGHH